MVVIQLIGIVAFVFLLIGFWSKSKNKILLMHLIANFIYSFHYFLLDAYMGSSVCAVMVVSDFFLLNKTDKKKLKRHGIIFSMIFLIVGMLNFTGYLSLMPVIGAIFAMYLLLKDDANEVRLGMVFASLMWSVYGLAVKSYVVATTETILAISNTVAYNKYKK
ncbi:MAG: YgjV family protein [Bacilli bacterium]|nr:YgjV family protein [Bacilli bacterium]MDD4548069.1 YgjV family protein [Bacilli bacterium]